MFQFGTLSLSADERAQSAAVNTAAVGLHFTEFQTITTIRNVSVSEPVDSILIG